MSKIPHYFPRISSPRILLFIIYSLLFSPAGAPRVLGAQPWTKKAAKSVFTLKTFDAQGAPIATATGFYVGTGGEALSTFAPFKGAASALVVDAAGKEHAVSCMLGANETYDVARFRTDEEKTQPLNVATETTTAQTNVWMMLPKASKTPTQATIVKTETIQQDYAYYTLKMNDALNNDGEGMAGAPLIRDDGTVVAIMQQPYKGDTACYAVSARFADSLRIGGLSINDPALRSTHIKKDLPDDLAQAQLTLYLAQQQLDSAAYATIVDDFIGKFPKCHDGYVARAQLAAMADRYGQADHDMEQALRVSTQPDEVHYSFARLIFAKLMTRPTPPYEPWTLERALREAQAANADNPQPIYRKQEADVMMAQKRYAEAAAIYEELAATTLRSPELFYEAAQCKALQGDTLAQMAMLDSCMTFFQKPYLKEAAPYILANAQARMDGGQYRQAVLLLNDYEKLMSTQVNDRFYYLRFQAEVSGRLYQQAINDIDKAIAMAPQSDLYYAEKATLLVKLGLYDETIEAARQCIAIAPDHSDGYLFLGLAQCLKGDKQEGAQNLKKAKELGDPQAEELIQKYAQ